MEAPARPWGDRLSFFDRAGDLERRGVPFATATVVRVEPPASARPGDCAIVTLDGRLEGWVGGHCARGLVIQAARDALREDRPRLLRLSALSDGDGPGEDRHAGRLDGLTDLPMTCYSGGVMEIHVKPHPPALRVLLIGDQPVARALAELARAMGYQVMGVATADVPDGPAGADEKIVGPEGIAESVHPLSFVVIATHGEDDADLVEHALLSPARYVGLVASPKRAESIRDHLRRRGLAEERLATLRSPAGLDLGARRPEEIALSILAEIVTLRRRDGALDWGAAAGTEADRRLESASDPVCGMTVELAGARHRHEHGGATYWFCCGGCRARFAEEPERYLAASDPPSSSDSR